MELRYLLFLVLLFLVFSCEGFTSVHHDNTNDDDGYPDDKQFFPVHNHSQIKLRNKESQTILGNNNYKVVKNSIKEPQKGTFSAFLDVHKIRTYDHFYHAPITEKSFPLDVGYDRQFDYEIIQEEDENKEELLKKEKENDNKIHDPFFLQGSTDINHTILYNDKIQDMFLKLKKKTERHENVSHDGPGYHNL
jgi:hypothetical protein